MRHGWLAIPGVQTGERTVEEQTLALKDALSECNGKSVLDLGCAEALIGREFAKAGASRVLGLDIVGSHLDTAIKVCGKWKQMEFLFADLNIYREKLSFDIVLCLNVIHKLRLPSDGLIWAASCAKSLLLLRSGRGADENGIIRGKHSGAKCDSHAILIERGFTLDKVVEGPERLNEPVEYWRC